MKSVRPSHNGETRFTIHQGDTLTVLRSMPAESIHCCITSPPYWNLRDYGTEGQLGCEADPETYVRRMVDVFREVRRVLRPDGTLWLNLGDTYRQGQLVGIPWLVAFALKSDGWLLRSDIVWHKPNAMPESVKNRPTKAHEYLFLLAKSASYHYDADAVREPHAPESLTRVRYGLNTDRDRDFAGRRPQTLKMGEGQQMCHPAGRNRRTVWTIATRPYSGAHFAVFPPALVEPCILAGCPEGGTVLDTFAGSGTTLAVAERLGRNSIGIELNPDYCELIRQRLAGVQPDLFAVST